jgi:hypothetical protein
MEPIVVSGWQILVYVCHIPYYNGLKQDALLLFRLNFALEYAIRMVQVNQDG